MPGDIDWKLAGLFFAPYGGLIAFINMLKLYRYIEYDIRHPEIYLEILKKRLDSESYFLNYNEEQKEKAQKEIQKKINELEVRIEKNKENNLKKKLEETKPIFFFSKESHQ